MNRRTLLATGLATAAAAATLAFAPAASAGTAWNVTIGAPGFVVSAGEPYAAAPYYRPYSHNYHYRHRHYAPPVVYAPSPYHYAPPRVVYRPAYVPPPVVYRPYYPY